MSKNIFASFLKFQAFGIDRHKRCCQWRNDVRVPATSPPAQSAFSPEPFIIIVFAKSDFSQVYPWARLLPGGQPSTSVVFFESLTNSNYSVSWVDWAELFGFPFAVEKWHRLPQLPQVIDLFLKPTSTKINKTGPGRDPYISLCSCELRICDFGP